ncbi:MAG: beta-ketoacyl-ACP synthase III [Opitutaceae bacterium]|jgi:3-oxoacyl-[acyl-carrier-protein] synthase-3
MPAFITQLSSFLPNEAVTNERIEDVLGRIHGVPSRTRAIILRNNRIRLRHYAIDPETGRQTHTNVQLTAEAVKKLAAGGFDLNSLECLACGTTSPDLMNPGHANLVHGNLGIPPLETASMQGICLSGMVALRYALMAVASGQVRSAVATGSELASSLIRAGFFNNPSLNPGINLEDKPALGFDADFLRWMLSDGAGAALVEARPREGAVNLRFEWLEMLSFANELPICMYIGGRKEADGSVTGWRTLAQEGSMEGNPFAVRQDVELLNREIIPTAVNRALERVLKKHPMKTEEVDWFVPHFSSDYFRGRLDEAMQAIGFGIPQERWFTNLYTKGNTGSASIYIILEELAASGRLRSGQKLLCFIPESGRFSIAYMLLSVV